MSLTVSTTAGNTTTVTQDDGTSVILTATIPSVSVTATATPTVTLTDKDQPDLIYSI
jgi:hypothetical protein